jgi:hypothetical protein
MLWTLSLLFAIPFPFVPRMPKSELSILVSPCHLVRQLNPHRSEFQWRLILCWGREATWQSRLTGLVLPPSENRTIFRAFAKDLSVVLECSYYSVKTILIEQVVLYETRDYLVEESLLNVVAVGTKFSGMTLPYGIVLLTYWPDLCWIVGSVNRLIYPGQKANRPIANRPIIDPIYAESSDQWIGLLTRVKRPSNTVAFPHFVGKKQKSENVIGASSL